MTTFKALLTKLALFLVASLVLAFSTGLAYAETPGPGWEVDETRTYPTNLSPGGTGYMEIDVTNVGAAPSDGAVTVTDVLPKDLTATESYGAGNLRLGSLSGREPEPGWTCAGERIVTCTSDPSTLPVIPPEGVEVLVIAVKVAAGASGSETNDVTAVGGGASRQASSLSSVLFNPALARFGFAHFDGWVTNADGTTDTQAGSHPYELTISINLNNIGELNDSNTKNNVGNVRNIAVNLPPGIAGDPDATPQCSRQRFANEECEASTQIGVEYVTLGTDLPGLGFTEEVPVYNLVPPVGIPAQFGFDFVGQQAYFDAGVRSGGDNGITVHIDNSPSSYFVSGSMTVIWGVPAEASHNALRCGASGACGVPSNSEAKPLLTLPTSCTSHASRFTIEANSWEESANIAKDEFLMHDNEGEQVGFTGCERLVHFAPKVAIAPETSYSDTPAGLGVEVRMPPDTNPEGLATSGLKNTTVTLPEGVVVNPGAATGLVACQPSQENIGGGEAKREEEEGPVSCPAASKIGTDEVESPLLKEKLVGSVYILQQNPPSLQLLVTASGEGVNLKLVGNVHLNEQTGQITTTFEETPDLPFTTFKLNFSGGAQAALATPVGCGVYSSSALFVPWASPFVANFPTSSAFQITSGPGGGACPGSPMAFTPSMIAGATTDQAGGFTDFSMLLQSGDGQQRIEKLQFKAPEGLAGMISSVPLCEEPQAAQGTCSAGSQIGHSIVASGPGPYPLTIPQAGDPESPIYLTGPYDGAPFGLSIVTHVIAGPFNLGTVITRARIEIDPHTAQVTVTTDPLPQIIAGVPTDLRTVDAVIDRPGFMFNPTNCEPKAFSGTAWGTPPPGAGGPGATAPLSSHFQMGSCRSLLFNPDFTVSTSGKTSRVDGASLEAKIVYPPVPLGANQASGQANSASVKVELPKQLPARLTTLQKACTSAQFDANPAGCPAASLIGHVEVITPVLPVPLMGPAYFVSNGGEAFPNLIMVLQGDGVTVDLVGDTFISKAGITSSTFKTVPDVPFTSFDLKLPEGPFSALTTDGNLCTSKLAMPTTFVGQNGAEVHENTKIAVTGCAKRKKAAKHAKRGSARGKRARRKR